jgi:hypothetical protein
LFFTSCPRLTDAGLAHLADMPNVERLGLVEEGGGMVITDAGLAHVARMKQLKSLLIIGMPRITDAGLAHLHTLSNLETFILHRTGVTPAGLQDLMHALPDCRIITEVNVPGPGNIQSIIVRKLSHPEDVIAKITDPQRITEIVAVVEQLPHDKDFIRLDEPQQADFVLECIGRRRVLYEIRLGAKSLQQSQPGAWTKWDISGEQQAQLLKLLRSDSPPSEQNRRSGSEHQNASARFWDCAGKNRPARRFIGVAQEPDALLLRVLRYFKADPPEVGGRSNLELHTRVLRRRRRAKVTTRLLPRCERHRKDRVHIGSAKRLSSIDQRSAWQGFLRKEGMRRVVHDVHLVRGAGLIVKRQVPKGRRRIFRQTSTDVKARIEKCKIGQRVVIEIKRR